MKGFGDQNKVKNKFKKSDNKTKLSKEQIINQAFHYHSKGKISEAIKYYQYCINKGFNDCRVFSNYGMILQELGKLQEAEICHRKAIELQPNFANAYCNLGNVLIDLGKFQDAELFTRKAIEINPHLGVAHSNLGIILKNLGKLQEAEISYRQAIELTPNYAETYTNLGNVLKNLGRLKDAEIYHRKAIELKPNYAEAYSNLANVLRDLGKFQDAAKSSHKAIEIKPHLSEPYYSLSLIKNPDLNKIWQDQLFSEEILKKQSRKDQVNIYFARANLLHKRKQYNESSIYLQLANNIKLDIYPSNSDTLIKKSRKLLNESDTKKIYKTKQNSFPECIFIVGMPRSGSTLVESILSVSNDVYDLGETTFLDDSFVECKNSKQDIPLAELYIRKVKDKTDLNITTNKNLYNYQYAGIIANQIPNAKIIHCFRNPLDNILSIYRAHFANGNEYSSSLVDCAKIYIDQEKVMSRYKNRFRSKIYDLNYDSLVSKPKNEIKSLLSWLGWKWNDSYLSPHLNPRSVSTASSVQVRSPINSQSISGWKNYKEMLKPAIEIITQIDRYKDLIL